MTRGEAEKYISDTYGVKPEAPWEKYPKYIVFRHGGNKKWFALIMEIPRRALGLSGEGVIDVVNVKCSPLLNYSFRAEKGIYPAYHMNKEHWLSVALDGSAEDETVRTLIDMSYELTKKK
ncbi:MAG: MmcQ/YjbR family DNA-binding protein [Clostridia bacterium]|nr:MmcQ/YjbR family DNA-binding protein [Clostridia bacterium]